ncbi:hypothetical protein BJY16_008070 [Actinoplanes octamycinicus]|uniref:Membrane-associated oxidoreductase n=1 Tax=Actinoplanes octamycinicus TaxID=135948 RepID=A0A7W7H5X6_9ACTN|nr:membrane-associated oxidoreductase [Actinoplanes octamycinicus]MBB4744611.1 hypothetical protein [Actinoplanes octamycinicus]GIE55193.1 hypothetical protein Aoc01nite_05950 [Actinoplanes octamycinicus]
MDDADLTKTERLVWDAFPLGERVDLRGLPDREVRATVLRALLLGARPPVAGEQAALRLVGAVVTGPLSLSYAEVPASISLRDSVLQERPDLYGLRVRRLTLAGSEMPGLVLGMAQIDGGVRLNGAVLTGELSLAGAQIGGALVMDGARLTGAPVALNGTELRVAGNVLARAGFQAGGELRLDGAEINGSLRLNGATLQNPGRWAIYGSGLRVGAVLDLSGGARIAGSIRLRNAVVGTVVSLSRATMTDAGPRALDLRRLEAGELILRPAAPLPGRVDLGYARIGLLRDDPETWPAELDLNGFAYEAIDGPLPVAERLDWLGRDVGGFRPLTYRRLAALYRAADRDDEARTVLLAGERRRRSGLPRAGVIWGWLQDVTVGYGYRPGRAAAWLAGLLAVGTLVFDAVPPRAAEAPKAPEFHAPAFAADLLLPVIDLGQQSAYLPVGWTAWFAYFLIMAGLLFATTAVAAVARRLRRD